MGESTFSNLGAKGCPRMLIEHPMDSNVYSPDNVLYDGFLDCQDSRHVRPFVGELRVDRVSAVDDTVMELRTVGVIYCAAAELI